MQKVESLSSKRIKLIFTINTTVSIYAMYTMHINPTPKGVKVDCIVILSIFRLVSLWCRVYVHRIHCVYGHSGVDIKDKLYTF